MTESLLVPANTSQPPHARVPCDASRHWFSMNVASHIHLPIGAVRFGDVIKMSAQRLEIEMLLLLALKFLLDGQSTAAPVTVKNDESESARLGLVGRIKTRKTNTHESLGALRGA